MGCRKVEEACSKLKEIDNSEGKYTVFRLDLQNLDSVRSFAEEVREKNQKIDESDAYKGKVSVFALHPGVIYSDLYVNMPCGLFFKGLSKVFMKSQAQGGEALVHASISPELDGLGGSYTENSQVISSSDFVSDVSNQKIFGLKL
ncbi:RDH12 [Lepeophtheirus salmonis]|uniref:RDH12 n=1 Tax=Lepeophtheirus salmonis TaxID=72036 RepID=A0A7R8CQQ8_LEPSM|nr:RDH12 [Lepeophtheirus salmonis]CAF2897875.1 RDH12 [Lepeophtheirus salmonis]